jgi:hypothetical protein
MSDNVNIVRLTTGEEIVCNVTTIENGNHVSYKLKDAAVLIPNPVDGRLMFGRWLPYAKMPEGITIDSKFVMFITEPSEDLRQHYVTTIINNLAVPSKKLVEPVGDNKLKLSID